LLRIAVRMQAAVLDPRVKLPAYLDVLARGEDYTRPERSVFVIPTTAVGE
jgi:hypothetical protein